MKKGIVIGFIFGIIVCSTFSAIAGSYKAKNVTYTPSDTTWNVSNVKTALDNIKETDKIEISNLQSAINNKQLTIEEKNNTIASLNSNILELQANQINIGTPSYSQSTNTMSTNTKQQQITLSKGKYFLVVNYGMMYGINQKDLVVYQSANLNISCNKECNTQRISSKEYGRSGSNIYTDNYYMYGNLSEGIFYLNVEENNTVVTFSFAAGFTNDICPSFTNMIAVPIN